MRGACIGGSAGRKPQSSHSPTAQHLVNSTWRSFHDTRNSAERCLQSIRSALADNAVMDDAPRPVPDLPRVTERDLAARARGLKSAYIPGGDDPDIERTRRREARYLRLLIGMVVLIVGSGLIVSLVGLALGYGAGQ